MPELHTFVDYVLYTKYWEYALAFSFMALFLAFYLLLRAPQRPATAIERAAAPQRVQGFNVPDGLLFHQGHTWARMESDDVAVVGLDDFAQKLVGRIQGVDLPQRGNRVNQGEPAWTLKVDSQSFPMLAPLGGEVLDVNLALARSIDALKNDPYGAGWLVKLRLNKPRAGLRNLLSGELVKRWIETAAQGLYNRADIQLGAVLSDGGAPIDGMAQLLDKANWPEIVRESFLEK